MKRTLLVLLALLLSFSILGCSKLVEKPVEEPVGKPVKNELFTDEFFIDVVEIAATGAGIVRGDQVQPVIQYLQGLTLTASDTHLIPQSGLLTGLGMLSFRKSDGTEIAFRTSHAMITCIRGLDLCSYVIEGGNLNLGLQEVFARAIQQYPE